MARWCIYRPGDKAHESEIRVAEVLRKLDDRWLVVWGYLYTDKKGTPREGDFLILGPVAGALVLEVKSSLPRIFTGTGYGEGDDSGDPFDQLMKEWAAVVAAMKGEGGSPFVTKAICVPKATDAEIQAAGFTSTQKNLLIGADGLSDLRSTWISLFGDKVRYPVAAEQQNTFEKAFCAGGVTDGIARFIGHTEELFRRHIEGQFSLLDQLSDNRQLLVSGGAGTGKTMHALEQAFRYASQGMDVLFLVYNLALTAQLSRLVEMRKLATGSVTVRGWEELFKELAGDAVGPPEASNWEATQEYYDKDLPVAVMKRALGEEWGDLVKYDALVVDEGQDHDTKLPDSVDELPEGGWWIVYQSLLKEGEEAPASVFYDVGQRPPFRGRDRFDVEVLVKLWSQPAMIRLQSALRYTRNIHELLIQHRVEETEELIQAMEQKEFLPEGPDPEFVSLKEGESVKDAVADLVSRWQSDGLCEPHEVLILHKRSTLDQSALGGVKVLGGRFNLREISDADAPKDAVRHCSINKAKGLDSKAVILVGMPLFEEITKRDDRYMWFMAVSRTRQLFAQVV